MLKKNPHQFFTKIERYKPLNLVRIKKGDLMSWKTELRKQIDMDIGSTNYAKDLGDSVQFGEGEQSVTIGKGTIPHLVAQFVQSGGYFKPITRLKQITTSSGTTDDFVRWYKQHR